MSKFKAQLTRKKVTAVQFSMIVCTHSSNSTGSPSCRHVNTSDSNQREDYVEIAPWTESTKEMERNEIRTEK